MLVAVYLSTPHDLRWLLFTSADRANLPIALILGYCFIVITKWAFRAIE